MKPTLLVLAAGMGSRYGGLKQLDKLGPSEETLMEYSIYDAIRAGFGKVVFVIRKSFEEDFKKAFVEKLQGKIEVELVFQELDNVPAGIIVPAEREKPWGTGHAILVAQDAVKTPFAAINADDFYGKEAYQSMADFLSKFEQTDKDQYAMCGYQLGNTLSDFGSVSRGVCDVNGNALLKTVTERTAISKDEHGSITYKDENGNAQALKDNDIVSMNFWGFTTDMFGYLNEKFTAFIKENVHQPKAEFYIPFVVDELMQEKRVTTTVLTSDAKWFGVTYKEDRPTTVDKLNKLVEDGVYPDNLWK
jgi:hypothetical protein